MLRSCPHPLLRGYLRHALVLLSLLLGACAKPPPPVEQEPEVSWVNTPQPAEDLTHLAFTSRHMGHSVGVSILHPQHAEPAPVIYFLHGRGGDETTDKRAFQAFLRPIIRARQLPEPLLVFPNGGLSGYRGDMASMLIEELIPYIDRHYATLPAPRHRVIAGFSMGGAGAVRLAIFNPGTFAGAVSWGGGMWQKDQAMLDAAAAAAEQFRSDGFYALLINGERDRPEVFQILAEVLDTHHVQHQIRSLPGVGHDMGQYFKQTPQLFGDMLSNLWGDPPL